MGLTPSEEQIVQKRVADNVCARCRRPLCVGHRVNAAYIVYDPNGYNPNRITERGLSLGTDHEFVHIDCTDPFLDGRSAARLILP